MLVAGAPVFTYHVEGDAALFRRRDPIFQLSDDPDAAAAAPAGTGILGSLRRRLPALARRCRDDRAMPPSRALPPRPAAARSDPAAYLLTRCALRAGGAMLVEEAPSHRPADAGAHADAPLGRLLHHGERRPRLLAAGRGRHRLAKPAKRIVCLIGDGSMMYSLQALWTAVQHRLQLPVVINKAATARCAPSAR